MLYFSKVVVFEIFKTFTVRADGFNLKCWRAIFTDDPLTAVILSINILAQIFHISVDILHPLRLGVVNRKDALITQSIVHVF